MGGKYAVRCWHVGDWSSYEDVAVSGDTIIDLAPLPGGARYLRRKIQRGESSATTARSSGDKMVF